MRRSDTGQWGLPGGLIDWGEDIYSSAKRELLEETGLELLFIKRLIGVYTSFERDPRVHSLSILLEVKAQGELKIADLNEVLALQSFFPSEIPFENLAHDHGQQLQDYLQGGTFIR
jgi:8-oxo-dGTP diphosphatase